MWDYTEKVTDHFINPRNVGEIENPDGIGEVGSLACGDALKLTFKLDDKKQIADVKFKTFGCASAIASSSALTEMIMGMTLEEAEKVNNKQIADYLGGLPDQKMHCSVMGKEALDAAIENYRTGSTKVHTLEGKVICKCFGLTDKEIETVVLENDLTTVEEVTNYCKAGGGCGGCFNEIEAIISSVQGEKAKVDHKPIVKRPTKLTNIQKMQLIQEIIDEQVRPTLKADGGDIDLIDIIGEEVVVAFRGMCANCKMAELTLRDVVQAKLREYVSENITVTEQK